MKRVIPDRGDGSIAPPEVPEHGIGVYGMTASGEVFDWSHETSPRVPSSDRVIYECHVKAATASWSMIPEGLRGTYLGLAHDAFLDRLSYMGVTTIELLPVASFVDESALLARGMRNVWGYNPIGFFAPSDRYRVVDDDRTLDVQFKTFVAACHERSIEIVLDVVYNHTAESDLTGPTLSLRGIDNPSYYRLTSDGAYVNWTGTGNTLDLRHTETLRLVMDAMRHWVTEYHVDGFRLDLASALSQNPAVDGHAEPAAATLFAAIAQDPVLAQATYIAEPWDATLEGQFLGKFPASIAEWNGRYRDDSRRFWSGEGTFGEAVRRFAGSDDLFAHGNRRPSESINFFACHDGFTTYDLTRFVHKRNWPNGWDNTDGSPDELTVRIDRDEEDLSEATELLRHRTVRSMMAWLLLSLGTPMLLWGDEHFRSQGGNNNAYCIDDETVWTQFEGEHCAREIGHLVEIRRRFGIGKCDRWFRPRRSDPRGFFDPLLDEVEFYRADGSLFDEVAWNSSIEGGLAMLISSSTHNGEVLFVGFNPHSRPIQLVVPLCAGVDRFHVSGWSDDVIEEGVELRPGTTVHLVEKGTLIATSGGMPRSIV